MQVTFIELRDKIPSWVTGLIRWCVFLGSFFFLYQLTFERYESIDGFYLPENWLGVFVLVILLMLLNYFIEAVRWRVALKDTYDLSLSHSLLQVFSGVTLNLVAPFTTGDVIVRLSNVSNRKVAIHALVLNRFLLMTLTFLFAVHTLGLAYLIGAMLVVCPSWYLLIMLYFKKYLSNLSGSWLLQLLTLSVCRFTVFVSQFFFLIKLFVPELQNGVVLAGIAMVFISKSLLPNLFGGLGIRELAGLLYFESHVEETSLILIPIFAVWIINVAVPSLIGLFTTWQLKFSTR